MKLARFVALLSLLLSVPLRAAALESLYSDLDLKKCRTIEEDKETGSSESDCRGIAAYRLIVTDDDLRQSVTVVDPKGQQHPLSFYSTISAGFSFLGPKAEWRIERIKGKPVPRALIVRVIASENPENPNQKTSYLAVAKITPEKICVTDKIPPGPKMNELAREAADASAGRSCLQPK